MNSRAVPTLHPLFPRSVALEPCFFLSFQLPDFLNRKVVVETVALACTTSAGRAPEGAVDMWGFAPPRGAYFGGVSKQEAQRSSEA